jgi:hypothetical protein
MSNIAAQAAKALAEHGISGLKRQLGSGVYKYNVSVVMKDSQHALGGTLWAIENTRRDALSLARVRAVSPLFLSAAAVPLYECRRRF